MKVATYLEFNLNATEVIETYQEVFNAELLLEYRFDEHMTDDEALVGKIFHAELKIGDLNLYLSDTNKSPSFNSMKFVVEITDKVEAKTCFDKLSRDGKVLSEFKKMSFGPEIAQVEDRFGLRWDIVVC